jgi:2-C-methyl-D-erythritol 4-phosphate cytidylyltransferase
MNKHVIIVAGGKGLRMGGDLPKQFLPLKGKPVLMHTLDAFHKWNPSAELILVIPKEHESYWNMLCKELNCNILHKVVYGGETRFHSVQNGLKEIKGEGLTAVHDGVRPFVSSEVITACFSEAERNGAAIPVVPMIESAREIINDDGSKPFDREKIRIVQTPQVFKTHILKEAYQQPYNKCITDDASLVQAAGYKIRLVAGNRENIKITTPLDLIWAENILERKDFR